MRAAVLREHHAPFAVEQLRDPEPRRGELLVRVAACGVCHSDLHIKEDHIAFPLPCVLGHEVAGTVVALGEGVTSHRVGDRVAGTFIMPCGDCAACRRGDEDLCEPFFAQNRLRGTLYDGETRLFEPGGAPISMYSMGGLAELAVLPVRAATVVPDAIALADAAVLGCAAFTAYGALRNAADLRVGEDVAIIGVGGVGANLVQFAAAFGAQRIVAVDVADEKLAAATALGATDVVDARAGNAAEAIRELTGGAGVHVAIDALGGPATFAGAVEALADGGRAVIVGFAPRGVHGEIDITRLVRRKLQIRGSFGARASRDMPAILGLVERGAVDVSRTITRRYTLDRVNDAYAALAAGEIVGRAVVEP